MEPGFTGRVHEIRLPDVLVVVALRSVVWVMMVKGLLGIVLHRALVLSMVLLLEVVMLVLRQRLVLLQLARRSRPVPSLRRVLSHERRQ